MKAQMGIPDMKLPIQYALGYPNRLKNKFPRFDFSNYPQLTFEPPDLETFPCLQLAFQAMNTGGNTPCILNAANEIAVESFLQDRIKFVDIPTVIEKAISHLPFIAQPDLNQLLQTDQETRKFVLSLRS
jgi:1-deoxy-D-xylulose-5-phosphate reductoisomerase